MSARQLADRIVDWTTGHLRQLRTIARKRATERELDEELAYHIELETRKNVAAGMSPVEARRAALVEFGGVERYKEEVRQRRWVRVIEDGVADLHYSIRMLRRQPALTLAVVTTLALGIGGTGAVFKVVDALFFRPPAGVVEPERVLRLLIVRDSGGIQTADGGPGSNIDYQALRGRHTGFASIAAYLYPRELDLGRGAEAERVTGSVVSENFLQLLGIRPALGRFFLPEEDSVEDRNPVVVISYGFWTRHFGRDPSVLGRQLLINDRMLTVIGVTDEEFTGIDARRVDVWIPTAMAAPLGLMWKGWRDMPGMAAVDFIGRLAPDVVASAATSEAATALRLSAENHPMLDPTPGVIHASLIPARGPHRSAAANLSLWLALVAAMTLVVACANVANLPYVSVQPLAVQVERDVRPFRIGSMLFSVFGVISVTLAAVGLYGVLAFFVTERTLEIGIRRSLGASVRSLISLVLRQAMLPVTAGLVLGLAAAFGGTRFLGSLLFGVKARDPISFLAAAALLIAVATIAALIPARRATRVDPAIAMRAE